MLELEVQNSRFRCNSLSCCCLDARYLPSFTKGNCCHANVPSLKGVSRITKDGAFRLLGSLMKVLVLSVPLERVPDMGSCGQI